MDFSALASCARSSALTAGCRVRAPRKFMTDRRYTATLAFSIHYQYISDSHSEFNNSADVTGSATIEWVIDTTPQISGPVDRLTCTVTGVASTGSVTGPFNRVYSETEVTNYAAAGWNIPNHMPAEIRGPEEPGGIF